MSDSSPGSEVDGPPLFVRLAADPTRWELLQQLALSDRTVLELTELVNRPQNDVSYHLGRLRAGGLVSMHRSAHDRRASYYRLDLTRCDELLATVASALHPGLTGASRARAEGDKRRRAASSPVKVLFVCTGNSGRSPMAEALLRQYAGRRVEVSSAGSAPRPLHPAAVRAMREYGIDLAGRQSRSLEEFTGQPLDYVITLCDRVREVCPDFPGHPAAIHWSLPNPADVAGRGVSAAFRETAADLRIRIEFLTARMFPEAA